MCMPVCICIYVYVCLCVYVCMYVLVCVCVCMRVCDMWGPLMHGAQGGASFSLHLYSVLVVMISTIHAASPRLL